MSDASWCPKHLRTIGALVPCGECEEERKGPKRYRVSYDNGIIEEDGSPRRCLDSEPMVLAADYDALLATVSALEKEVERLRKDAERYRYVCKHGFPNRHRNDAGELYWTYYDGTSWNSCHAAIDAQLAAMRTGEGE